MTKSLDILPAHHEIVTQVLERHLPKGSKIWVFGSRAKGNAKKFSDLDLAIDAGQPLSLEILARLNSDFVESSLPYKVDIVDWREISDNFRQHIQDQLMVLTSCKINRS